MFKFLKRNTKPKIEEDQIPLMDAKTARSVYMNKLEEKQEGEWKQANAVIPQIAKAIAKASANGDYQIRYTISSESVSRKVESLLKEKGYRTHTRYGSSEIEITW